MKGYEMIVIVNGIVFLVVGLLTFLNGAVLEHQGTRCPTGNATQCQRDLTIGETTRTVAPYLFSVGIALLGTGTSLVLYRRRYGTGPQRDEDPRRP